MKEFKDFAVSQTLRGAAIIATFSAGSVTSGGRR